MNRARPGTPAPTGEQPGPVPEDLPVAGPPLVVGVDGSPDATAAAVWAAEEAVRRHRACRC
ncbi:hypothetical protein [Actinomycetospora cinnamomea]|uniref:Universal stress protein family protein n=1 Tax=Actinomycetospora cinnamomea TaxID=663609 RepID=A0A2U1F3T8_9PSEU|nr:hypothetical protein [Actinomycetospora cinnamomea]PVZ06822.1 hypothetical protein C8D89_11215 [Actinomycetospora cinnamomea]